MIVRNEESNLSHCLTSVDGLFDETVIVDTGSTDRTIEIARSFGARVFDFPWVDDFAAARNAALARATGDYAFWLDADDVVEPPEREKLEAHLHSLGTRDDAGYVVRCAATPHPTAPAARPSSTTSGSFRCARACAGRTACTSRSCRACAGSRFRCSGPTSPSGTPATSTWHCAAGSSSETPASCEPSSTSGPTIRSSCSTWARSRLSARLARALGYLERSLAGSAPSDSIVRKLYALIARAHQMRGDSHGALRTCADGLSLDPEDAELWFRKAVVHRHRGESTDAETCWRRILTLKRPNQFCSVDQGIFGHLTRRNLAAIATERGDHSEAESLWQAVLAECPGDREATQKLNRA